MSPAFKRFVIQMAKDFSCPDPNWFMACIAFETMETFSPSIRPMRDGVPLSSAVGLIQMLRAVAAEVGTTPEALALMTQEEQLPYVWKYFRLAMQRQHASAIPSLTDCYMLIHWPAAFGLMDSATLYVAGSAAYAANAGLDTNGDHVITKAEAGALVRAKLDKGLTPEFFG